MIVFENIQSFDYYLKKLEVCRVVNIIQNHHTQIPSYKHFKGNNHLTLLRNIDSWHKKRGFDEIGQNITIFPDGRIAVCREINKAPAGCFGTNANGIALENIGNFDKNKDIMTAAHTLSLLIVNALLCIKFKLKATENSIVYHHWYDRKTGKRTGGSGITKSCPGTAFFGGNKIEDAKKNFLPLVNEMIRFYSSTNKV